MGWESSDNQSYAAQRYESTHTFIDEPAKQTGQLGGMFRVVWSWFCTLWEILTRELAGEKHTKSEMRTTVGSAGEKRDQDVDMARHLEPGGPGGGIRGESDKGMYLHCCLNMS